MPAIDAVRPPRSGPTNLQRIPEYCAGETTCRRAASCEPSRHRQTAAHAAPNIMRAINDRSSVSRAMRPCTRSTFAAKRRPQIVVVHRLLACENHRYGRHEHAGVKGFALTEVLDRCGFCGYALRVLCCTLFWAAVGLSLQLRR